MAPPPEGTVVDHDAVTLVGALGTVGAFLGTKVKRKDSDMVGTVIWWGQAQMLVGV